MSRHTVRTLLLATVFAGPVLAGAPAWAQTADKRISDIEVQIKSLQIQLQQVTHALRDAQTHAIQESARARTAERRMLAQNPTAAPATGGQAAPYAQTRSGGGQPTGSQFGVGQSGQQQIAQNGLDSSVPGSTESASAQTGAVSGSTSQQQSGQASSPLGTFKVGGVTVQLGGFIEAAGIVRSRNETADIASSFNGVPEGNTAAYHENEFRESSHQSRISLLVSGDPTPEQKLAAYFETDFQGVGTTSNSNESNSYALRLRQAYAQYDNTELGLHVLGGQAWSLLTMNKVGIVPRQENVPLTIDAQYAVGFDWARQVQFRVAKDFDDRKLWLALSVEEPQVTYSIGPNGAGVVGGTANYNNAGGSGLNATNNYSTDVAPDIVVKAAYDPGYGHFETYGVARFFRDRVDSVGQGHNNTLIAGGGGAAALLPIIPKALDFQLSGLVGEGIGRYGTGSLPDATLDRIGRPVPLPEFTALAGLVGHPVPAVDLYGYAGVEQILDRRSFTAGGLGYGYGSSLYNNAGCGTELSTAGCVANTSSLIEGTFGGWWRFLQGNYGTMQVGAQYEYVKRNIFSGVGGGKGTDDNIGLVSFRYAPFQ